ncbi:hypothetical protein [Streptomyces sp. NPDC049813]|uniref:hypothetical protein n=1 Tax=Streptomyces sp. NPDC049813 TaxID=3365597 RepID=UPI0037B99794
MNDDAHRAPLATFIAGQLAEERAKKASFETRGMAVISAAGTLISIATGFLALAASSDSLTLPHSAQAALLTSLALLVLAAVLGVLVNLPVRLPHADADGLLRLLAPAARFDPAEADLTHIETIKALRRVNRQRGRLLAVALLLVVLALALMMAGAAFTL